VSNTDPARRRVAADPGIVLYEEDVERLFFKIIEPAFADCARTCAQRLTALGAADASAIEAEVDAIVSDALYCAYEAAEGFRLRRHKIKGRGTERFSEHVVFGELGVLRLKRVHLGPPPCASR